jgi:four helix bundle protein
MRTFRDLDAFQYALDLMVEVYARTANLPQHELFGLSAQIRRASVSVVSHIAEGQGRLTYGEWRQMLSQARGSLYEVQAQIIACQRLAYFSDGDVEAVSELASRAARPLAGLIRYVRNREFANRKRR